MVLSRSLDRALLSRLVDAHDRIAEESLGMGGPEFHESEGRLFDAIADSGYWALIKHGRIYLPDPNGRPGEIIPSTTGRFRWSRPTCSSIRCLGAGR